VVVPTEHEGKDEGENPNRVKEGNRPYPKLQKDCGEGEKEKTSGNGEKKHKVRGTTEKYTVLKRHPREHRDDTKHPISRNKEARPKGRGNIRESFTEPFEEPMKKGDSELRRGGVKAMEKRRTAGRAIKSQRKSHPLPTPKNCNKKLSARELKKHPTAASGKH